MPIALGIIAIVALVGGGVFFFSDTASTPTTTPREENVARVESEATNPETITPEVTTETPTTQEPETSTEDLPLTTEVDTVGESDMAESAGPTELSADATYLTPARTSHDISVSVTLDATGVITATEVVYDGGAGFSNGHQERFDNAIAAEVIGKQPAEIELSRVGGASLTTEAFNEAVADIAAQQA